MSDVNENANELTEANLSGFATQDTGDAAGGAEVTAAAKPKRTSKKRRSEATLEVRRALKRAINESMANRDISVAEFAKKQGNKRQYIYRALSMTEDAASIDQLVGFAKDLGIKVDIRIS